MFCPNCGNNCENANFCPKCGTKLENNSGTFCGAQLCGVGNGFAGNKRRLIDDFLGEHGVVSGYFCLNPDNLELQYNKKYKKHTIPYAQITAVYIGKGKGVIPGWLSVRWKENANAPFPTRYMAIESGDTTVTYYPEDNEHFRRIYHALQAIIRGQDSPTGSA